MKVTWHTYESAVSALGLQTITFDSSIVLGNDDASGTGQHTLYSWLISTHQQQAPFDSFFADRRSAEQNRAAPGLYANVEAAKVAYKKDKRVLIKRWFLDEVKKHLQNQRRNIHPVVLRGWNEGQVWEYDTPEGVGQSRGLETMAADENFQINEFFKAVQKIVYPVATQLKKGWVVEAGAFLSAEEEIKAGKRIESLKENLKISKEYNAMMGVQLAHKFIKTYVTNKAKHKALKKLLDNSLAFRGVDQDGSIVATNKSPLLAYEERVQGVRGELNDIKAYLKAVEDKDPWLSEQEERGSKLVYGDPDDELSNRVGALKSLATGALSSGGDKAKEWFGLEELSATPKSELFDGTAYAGEYTALREYLISFCKNNKFKSATQIEANVERIQENLSGGARIEEQIQKENAKDTLQKLIEDNKEKARFMEQCFLLHNILPLSKMSQSHSERFKYLKIVDGGPDVVSRMHKRLGFEEMMNITQDKLALLQPTIELYKRVYEGDNKIPRDERFIFDDHTTQSSIENILTEASGRVGSVGIQSMTVEYQGTDMESAKRILSVKLKIFVQNMSAFFAEYADRADYIDLIAPSRAFRGKGYKTKWLKDMFSGIHYHESQVHDPIHFEIKAVLGWSVPTDRNSFLGQKLKNALVQNRVTALLTLNDHTFNFNQDGTMTIDIDYHGRIEGLLEDDSRTSLFETREMREERQKHLDSFNKAVQEVSSEIDRSAIPERNIYLKKRYKEKNPSTDPDSLTAEQLKDFENELIAEGDQEFKHLRKGQMAGLNSLVESKQKQIKEVKSKILKLTHDSYKRLIEALENRGFTGATMGIGGVSYISVDKEEMDFHTKAHGGAFGKFGDSLGSTKTISPPPPQAPGVDATDSIKLSTDIERQILEKENAAAQKDKNQAEIKESTNQSSPAPSLSSGNYEFGYFFLGDLIDVALQLLDENGLNGDSNLFDVITGPLIFGTEEAKINLNIADIPVSVSEFQHWFVENVVKKDKTSWTFAQFLRAIATKIIFPALGGRCYEREAPMVSREGNKLGMTILTYPSNPFENLPNRVTIAEVMEKLKGISKKRRARTGKGVHESILLHADFVPLTSKSGNIKEDLDAGIYHLVLGKDRGLIKEINFSKDALPFYKEDRMHMDGSIERISHPYVADVRMVGNTYFYPGSRVFVNPALTTGEPANTKNSIVSKLGLGGYYVVLGVVLKVEGHTFETQLRTKWESNGWKTSQDPARTIPTRRGEVVRLGDSDIAGTPESLSVNGEQNTKLPSGVRLATKEEREATARIKQKEAYLQEQEEIQREAMGGTVLSWNTWNTRHNHLQEMRSHPVLKDHLQDTANNFVGQKKKANITQGEDGRFVVHFEDDDGQMKVFTVLKPSSEE